MSHLGVKKCSNRGITPGWDKAGQDQGGGAGTWPHCLTGTRCSRDTCPAQPLAAEDRDVVPQPRGRLCPARPLALGQHWYGGGRAASLRPLWCHQPAMALAALEKRALVLALGDHGRAPGEGAGAPQPRVQAEGQPPGPQHPLASCRCQAGPWGGLCPQGCTLPALPPPAAPSQGCGCPWGGQRITREGLLRAQPQPRRQSAGGFGWRPRLGVGSGAGSRVSRGSGQGWDGKGGAGAGPGGIPRGR